MLELCSSWLLLAADSRANSQSLLSSLLNIYYTAVWEILAHGGSRNVPILMMVLRGGAGYNHAQNIWHNLIIWRVKPALKIVEAIS